jgi:exonuclease VII small subunit
MLTMMNDRYEERLAALEEHVAMLDMIQQLLLRILSVMHPLSNVLAQYGATSGQEQELLQYIDELAERVHSLERNRPSFDDFQRRIGEILPALRDDHEFLRLVIDTLRVERAAYRELHEYMIGQGWPSRTSPAGR